SLFGPSRPGTSTRGRVARARSRFATARQASAAAELRGALAGGGSMLSGQGQLAARRLRAVLLGASRRNASVLAAPAPPGAASPACGSRGISASLLAGSGRRELPEVPQAIEALGWHTANRIEEAKCLHPAFYTDEAYAVAERERIFGTQWFAAAHVQELSSPGDVKLVEFGDTSIVLTCDKKNHIHAFYNTCRHRGARVCTSSQKKCKQLVCPYHWWAYRLDGTLKATPPAHTPKERKESLGLLPVPGVGVFAGVVFLNQMPNPPPLLDMLGDLPDKLSNYDLGDMDIHRAIDYDIKGNWKLIAENFVDFYHIDAVHPALAKFSKVEEQLSLLMAPNAKKEEDTPDQYTQKCDDLWHFVRRVNEEDIEAIENLQRGLVQARQTAVPGEFLPKYDWPVHRFQNMVLSGLHGDQLNERNMPEYSSTFARQMQSSAA
ncbi:unnamed protein product, partial [Prorocentrum cordatum]